MKKIHALLKPKGCFYLSMKQDVIEESFVPDSRYGNAKKHWSFFEASKLAQLLEQAKFQIKDIAVANKQSDYHTHPLIKIFAES